MFEKGSPKHDSNHENASPCGEPNQAAKDRMALDQVACDSYLKASTKLSESALLAVAPIGCAVGGFYASFFKGRK